MLDFERGTERSEIDRSERDVPRRGTVGRRDQRALANSEKPGVALTGMAPRSGAVLNGMRKLEIIVAARL